MTFTFLIVNNSTTESVSITSLTDSVFGDLDGKGTCSVPQIIASGANYSCQFTTTISGNPGDIHNNTATASGTGSVSGIAVSDDDPATVNITGTTADISGFVYDDLNANGSFDVGEPPISGVAIELQSPQSSVFLFGLSREGELFLGPLDGNPRLGIETDGLEKDGFCDWTPTTLRLYYWVAAYMTAATLGQGSAYIHFDRRRAHALAALLGIAGAGALAACFAAPMDPAVPLPPEGVVNMEMFPVWLRSGTLFFNVYGLLLLAGGAARSMAHYRRAEDGARRFWANLLILVGVLVIGAAGGATKAGATEVLLYAELLGLVLLAAGVYVAG